MYKAEYLLQGFSCSRYLCKRGLDKCAYCHHYCLTWHWNSWHVVSYPLLYSKGQRWEKGKSALRFLQITYYYSRNLQAQTSLLYTRFLRNIARSRVYKLTSPKVKFLRYLARRTRYGLMLTSTSIKYLGVRIGRHPSCIYHLKPPLDNQDHNRTVSLARTATVSVQLLSPCKDD